MTIQIAVIGLGLFGSAVATTLAEQGQHVLGIDIDEKATSALMQQLAEVVTVTEINESILQSLSITEYDAVVVGITDIEASLTIAQMLRDLGVKHIVCKAKSPLHGKILLRIGVDRVIYPERDMGMRVAQSLVATSILGSIVLSPQQHIVTALAPESCIGHPVGTIPWRTETKIVILAIHRGTEVHANPGATFAIQADDLLVMLGSSADIATVLA